MRPSSELTVLTGEKIHQRFADISMLALDFGLIRKIDEEILKKKTLPIHGEHAVFINDSGIAISHETYQKYMVLDRPRPKAETRMHVWFASSPSLILEAHNYFLEKYGQARTNVLIHPNQSELTDFANRYMKYVEGTRAGDVYSTNFKF